MMRIILKNQKLVEKRMPYIQCVDMKLRLEPYGIYMCNDEVYQY